MKLDTSKHTVSVPADHYTAMMRNIEDFDGLDDLLKGLIGYISRYVAYTSSVAPRLDQYLKEKHGIKITYAAVMDQTSAKDEFEIFIADIKRINKITGEEEKVKGVSTRTPAQNSGSGD